MYNAASPPLPNKKTSQKQANDKTNTCWKQGFPYLMYRYYNFPNNIRLCFSKPAKFSHDDFYIDINWFFKLNEIFIWNRNPTNTLINCILCVFKWVFPKALIENKTRSQITHHYFETLTQKYLIWLSLTYKLLTFLFFHLVKCVFCSLQNCAHRTHTKCNWSVYCLVFCLICWFHWDWRSNRCLNNVPQVKT